MKTWSARAILIVALVVLYVLVAFPLPYLLLDHSSAMQAGDEHHSDRDVHAWLEWAAGSSISEAPLLLPASLAPQISWSIPSAQVWAVVSDASRYLRGPPTIA